MMKKYLPTIVILTFLCIPLFSYADATTSPSNPYGTLVQTSAITPAATPPPNTTNPNQSNNNGNLSYTPLETLPGMTPGATPDLPSYLAIMFKVLIIVGALVAVGALAVSGLTIMFSEVSGKLTAAKSRAQAAVWGLVIIAASYLFLQTINPQLVSFNFIPGTVAVTGAPANTNPFLNIPPCVGLNCYSAAEQATINAVKSGADTNPADIAQVVQDQTQQYTSCNQITIPNCNGSGAGFLGGILNSTTGSIGCHAVAINKSITGSPITCGSQEINGMLGGADGYTQCTQLATGGVCLQ